MSVLALWAGCLFMMEGCPVGYGKMISVPGFYSVVVSRISSSCENQKWLQTLSNVSQRTKLLLVKKYPVRVSRYILPKRSFCLFLKENFPISLHVSKIHWQCLQGLIVIFPFTQKLLSKRNILP